MGLGMRSGCAALVAALAMPAAVSASPSLTARAAIVMDAATGDVLWERDAFEPLPRRVPRR
jgi:D-alanyl-D-alanine carboxypeptidase